MNLAYKYCSATGAAILENLEIKISPPIQFNDPFEFTPRMIWSNPLGRATRIIGNKAYMKMLYDDLKREGRIRNHAEFKNYVKSHKPKMARALADGIPAVAKGVQWRQEILSTTSRRFGVLCLSRRRDSILMWGHYCDSHRGIVIAFDASHAIFHPKSGKGLCPVRYVRERVLYDATWNESDPEMNEFEEQITFSKSMDWDYEQELRQMFDLTSLSKKPLADGSPGYFLPVPPDAIVSVSLGVRCPKELVKRVNEALRREPRLGHVKVERAVLHESEFALGFSGG